MYRSENDYVEQIEENIPNSELSRINNYLCPDVNYLEDHSELFKDSLIQIPTCIGKDNSFKSLGNASVPNILKFIEHNEEKNPNRLNYPNNKENYNNEMGRVLTNINCILSDQKMRLLTSSKTSPAVFKVKDLNEEDIDDITVAVNTVYND